MYISKGSFSYDLMIHDIKVTDEVCYIDYEKGKEFIDYVFSEVTADRDVYGLDDLMKASTSYSGVCSFSRYSNYKYNTFKLNTCEFLYKGVKLIPKNQLTYANLLRYWEKKTNELKNSKTIEDYTGHFSSE